MSATSARPTPLVVEASGLRNNYGRTIALDDLDLGSVVVVFALLGASRAGKTTAVKILLG